MPLIVWASASGAPGVTTTLHAVAAAWPPQDRLEAPGLAAPVVVEADPRGGDLAAWYRVAEEPGLAGLAAAVRSPRGPEETVAVARAHARRLGGAAVVTAPVGAQQTRLALGILAVRGGPLSVAGLAGGAPLLVDAGRLSPASPIAPLVTAADLIVLVTRGGLADLAHARDLASELALMNPRRQVVLRGRPAYPPDEIAAQFGIPVLGVVPDVGPASLARSRQLGPVRRRSRWARVIASIARQLADEVSTGTRTPPSQGGPARLQTSGRPPLTAQPGVPGGWPTAADRVPPQRRPASAVPRPPSTPAGVPEPSADESAAAGACHDRS